MCSVAGLRPEHGERETRASRRGCLPGAVKGNFTVRQFPLTTRGTACRTGPDGSLSPHTWPLTTWSPTVPCPENTTPGRGYVTPVPGRRIWADKSPALPDYRGAVSGYTSKYSKNRADCQPRSRPPIIDLVCRSKSLQQNGLNSVPRTYPDARGRLPDCHRLRVLPPRGSSGHGHGPWPIHFSGGLDA